jgi:hypothetical protein
MYSCKSKRDIVIYKNKENIAFGYFTNSIDDFRWKYKSEDMFDSINLNKEQSKKLYNVINNLNNKNVSKESIGTPRYAFILDFKNKRDTLYFSDFNDEYSNNEGFFIQNRIKVNDDSNKLKKILLKEYKDFIEKEYYYLPNNGKELNYQKEHNNDSLYHEETHGEK